jgi:acyl carrier protein
MNTPVNDTDVTQPRIGTPVPLNSRSRFGIRAVIHFGPAVARAAEECSDSTVAGRGRRDQRHFMSTTFETVANIIAETCDIPRENITPESHAIDDLGIDSLDFLDIAFAIDKAFGIKLPLESWTQEVNEGKATTEQYFVLKNLCARIDELIAAKTA